MHDETKVAEVMAKMGAALKGPAVRSISDHFAGYFDELGVTIDVELGTSDEAVSELMNRAATIMASMRLPFKWIVMFRRGGESAGDLFSD